MVLPEAAYQVIDLIAGKHLESLHAQNVRPACANLLGRCSPGHAHAASGLPGQASAFGTAFWWSLGFTVIAIIQRAVERGEIDPGRLSPRIASLPLDLARHDLIMNRAPVPDKTLTGIVDRLFLPLVLAGRPRRT